jgi:hypothetical protein
MKKSLHLIGLLGLLSLAAIGSALAQDDAPLVMPGTEPPVAHSAGENTECFVFSKYVVKTAASEDGGSNVSVYKRESPGDACETEGDRWLYVEDADNNSFFGISGKYLFIDMGTSVESRTIDIYDLGQQKSVLSLGYSGDPKLTDGRFILFDESSDKNGPLSTCKEAAKWKRQGGGVGWVQGKKLDLQTMKSINVGTLRCVYME